jgi:hypothetical protein
VLKIYQILYGVTLAVFLGNMLSNNAIFAEPLRVSPLLSAIIVILCCMFALLFGFSRVSITVFWALTAAFEALFVWYAWYSLASPFVIHEVHSFDPALVSHEITMHYWKAGGLFGTLFVWFLSLPIVRTIFTTSRPNLVNS